MVICPPTVAVSGLDATDGLSAASRVTEPLADTLVVAEMRPS